MKICYYCRERIKSEELTKHGLHESCFDISFKVKDRSNDFQNISLKQGSKSEPSNTHISRFNESFFHGAFKKYSAEIKGEQYILKVSQDEYPELPYIEWTSNRIFKILKINIPEFYLIDLEGVQPTFVTKNFMTKRHGSNLIHIYHFFDKNEAYNCENLINIIQNKCGRLTDIKSFIEMTLCDSLIGNHDRHGRNIALIQSGPSKFELSPIYDNPSIIGIEPKFLLGADLCPRGKIFTSKSEEPTFKDYKKEFILLGHEEIVGDFIKRVRLNWKKIILEINKSFASEKRKEALIKLLEKRKCEL